MALRHEIAVIEPETNETNTTLEFVNGFYTPFNYRENNTYTLQTLATKRISSTGILSNRSNNILPIILINVFEGGSLYGRYIAGREFVAAHGEYKRVVITGWTYYTFNKTTKQLELYKEKKSLLIISSIMMKVYSISVILMLLLFPFFNGSNYYDKSLASINFFMVIFLLLQWIYLDVARKQYKKSVKYKPNRVMLHANIPIVGTAALAFLDSELTFASELVDLLVIIVIFFFYLLVLIIDEKQSLKI